jgi:UrcA family protein
MFRLLRLNFGITFSLLAILLAPLSASAATSAPSDNPRTRVVTFGDLDLTRSEGAKMLYLRIRGAARDVCEPKIWLLESPSQTYDCRHRAIAKAIADVGASTLTEYYQTKTPSGISEGQHR